MGAGDGKGFAQAIAQHGARRDVRPDPADRQAHQRGQAGEGRKERHLVPDVAPDVLADPVIDAGRSQGGGQAPTRFDFSVKLAEDEARHGAGVADHARLGDHGGDVRDTADDLLSPEHAGEHARAVDPVLQRDHPRTRPEQGLERCGGGLGVVELDREDHQIDRADRGRVAARLRRPDQDVAERAAQRQPVLPERREMRAPREEGDVLPGSSEAAADVAADPARSHDRDAQ